MDQATKLTRMQQFYLDTISNERKECSARWLAFHYYTSIGSHKPVASRDSFGHISASYRTCRKLVALGLIQEIIYKSASGYSDVMYAKKINH